jgi:GH25 family lysozyme M1 (1,4-beta-N-acetylmuramidase)
MKFAAFLIKSGLTVASAGLYLLARRFFRKVKRTAKETIEKVEHKLEKNSPVEDPENNANLYMPNL